MYTGPKRRLFYRIEGEVKVKYCPEGDKRKQYTTTKNISGGGMRIKLGKKITPSTILDLEIFRKKLNVSASCKGKIIWIAYVPRKGKRKGHFEAGVKFIDLSNLFIGSLISDLEIQNTATHLPSIAIN